MEISYGIQKIRKGDDMELKEFAGIVCEGIQKEMGEDFHICVTSDVNEIASERTGILFMKKQSDISPAIFIDDLFEDYSKQGKDVEGVVREVIARYEKSMKTVRSIHRLNFDWESSRKRVIYRLVSRHRNRKMLQTMPYIPFLDMAITFHVVIGIDHKYMQTVKIDHKLQEQWNVSVECLLKMAENNTEQILPFEIYDMERLAAKHGYEHLPFEEELRDTNMIVMTNSVGLYGASAILYPGLFEALAQELECDIYVIPSSVHEMILIPAENQSVYAELSLMIHEINQRFVPSDEVLSEQVYVFVREENKFITREKI